MGMNFDEEIEIIDINSHLIAYSESCKFYNNISIGSDNVDVLICMVLQSLETKVSSALILVNKILSAIV